jgi:hypothetical protein
LTYNGTTVLHYLLGALGIILGYRFSWIGYPLGFLYLAFVLMQMYVIMPLVVCPNCVYSHLEGSRCVSALCVVSRRIAREGDFTNFQRRAKGLLSHNKLYMTSLIFPVIAMLPALFLNFSFLLLILFLVGVGLLLFRIFVTFPRIACVHCRAKNMCPNAAAMGLGGNE